MPGRSRRNSSLRTGWFYASFFAAQRAWPRLRHDACASPCVIDVRNRDNDVVLDDATRALLGRAAHFLAQMAGDYIVGEYGGKLAVEYKEPLPGSAANSNPVSRADAEVEALLRSNLAAEFPDHTVIGEELAIQSRSSPFIWVIDPIDGTTNYINRVPLFAVSVGSWAEVDCWALVRRQERSLLPIGTVRTLERHWWLWNIAIS
jgi:hypothetical protein